MKTRWILSTWMLLCLADVAPLPRGLALPVLLGEPASIYADAQYEAFKAEFREAQKINAKPKMAQLLKQHQEFAIWWINDTCIGIAVQTSAELEKLIADLRVAWVEAYDTSFVENMYTYYSLLTGPKRKNWIDLTDQYDKVFARDKEAKTSQDVELVGRDYKQLALSYEGLGDFYQASHCWLGHGVCMDEARRQEQADLYAACEAYKRAVQAFEKIDLQSGPYFDAKNRYEVLARTGYDGPPPAAGETPAGPEAGPGGAAPGAAAPAAAIVAALSYSAVQDFQAVQRPFYSLDEMYAVWPQVALQKEGSSSTFLSRPDGPQIVRTGASKVAVDIDRDGEGDVEIPMTGNFELVQVETGEGQDKRQWGFVATIGIEKDTYQHAEVNLSPADEYMTLYYLPAASATARIGDVELRIFDDNFDGVYGSAPQLFLHLGTTTKGIGQAEMDSVQIGDSKRAAPWSEYQQIGGQWYKLASLTDTGKLEAKPMAPKVGTLALEFDGPKPAWLVVRGMDEYANSYFDLAEAGKKGITVPAGRYQLFYGELRKGKKKEELKALITPPTNTPAYSVAEGETTTIQLGEPFKFDFDFRLEGEKLTVVGDTVTIVGKAGERYERVWNSRPEPEASWRKAGAKRGSKPESMSLMDSQWDTAEKGWKYFWFPFDLEFEVQGVDKAEVQLVEKKNKLFGKIESDWKE